MTTATTNPTTAARREAVLTTLNALEATERYSTVGDAQLVEAAYKDRMRYVPAWRAWLVYQGGRWGREAGEEHAGRLVEDTLRIVAHHAADDLHTDSGKKLNSHIAHAFDKVPDIVQAARRRPDLMTAPRELDTHLDLLNVANGIVDLTTGALLPHDPAKLLTRQAPVIYREDWMRGRDWARVCPTWLRFLDDIFAHDAAVVDWMQRVLGYCLTGRTDEQVLFMAYGRGRNGKSTLNEVMQTLLGDYAATIKPETLVKQSAHGLRDENSPDPELSRLPGVRLAVSSEPPNTSDTKAGITDDARVKLITGSERIAVRAHYGHAFEYVPQFKVLLAVNRLPRKQEHTEGSERRTLTIPFNARFVPGENADGRMKERLLEEREGIIAWLVAGAVRWYATSKQTPLTVGEPTVVAQLNEEYKREQDPYRAFFLDELARVKGTRLLLADAYTAFMTWRKTHEEELLDALGIGHDKLGYRFLPTITLRGFKELAGERGFTSGHTKQGAAFEGVCLRKDAPGDGTVTEVTERPPVSVTFSRERAIEKLPDSTPIPSPASPPKIVPVLTPGTVNRRDIIRNSTWYGRPLDDGRSLPTAGCRHPRAERIPDGRYAFENDADETRLRCPDCVTPEREPFTFLCEDVAAHRTQWDASGCPLCDAAFAARWQAGAPAREAERQREHAEWQARDAAERAEWKAKLEAEQAQKAAEQAQRDADTARWAAALDARNLSYTARWIVTRLRDTDTATREGLASIANLDPTKLEDFGVRFDQKLPPGFDKTKWNEACFRREVGLGPTVGVKDVVAALRELEAVGAIVPATTTGGEQGIDLSPDLKAAAGSLLHPPRTPYHRAPKTPATEKQVALLRKLGYTGDTDLLDIRDASGEIDYLKNKRPAIQHEVEEAMAELDADTPDLDAWGE